MAWIAHKQWETAYQRIGLDLFERRMAVYDAMRSVVQEILREGRADTATFFRYVQATDRLAMLFGDEVVRYSDATRNRINQLGYHSTMVKAGLEGQPVEGYQTHVQKQSDYMTELSKFFEEFPPLIAPYVRMTQRLS